MKLKHIIIIILSALLIIIGAATFIEKIHSTTFVADTIYGTWWFATLWITLVISGSIYLWQKQLYKRLASILLHFSFIIILLGALITALTAKQGYLTLSTDDEMTMFTASSGAKEYIDMPITIRLDKFEQKYYPGTKTPEDFIDHLTVTDKQTGKSFGYKISMNHILSYRGMRFYQSSYNPSERTSTLSVYTDPWGIMITYTGYFLLIISFFLLLASPKGYFRKLLRNPLLRRGAFVLGLLILSPHLFAAGRTLPKEDAVRLGRLQVLYNGRIAPLQTLAYDFCQKITGKRSYQHLTPEQLLCGWLFWPETWEQEPMIKIKKKSTFTHQLGISSPASFSDFFTPQGNYRLESYWMQHPQMNSPEEATVSEIDEKIQLISMLRQGSLLKLYPLRENNHIVWYAQTDTLPQSVPSAQQLFIKNIMGILTQAVVNSDQLQFNYIIDKLQKYQKKEGGISCLTETKVDIETCYNRFPFTTLLYRLNLTLGIVALTVCFVRLLRQQQTVVDKKLFLLFLILLIGSFFILSSEMGMRMYISGRLPMSNGYETMIFLAWLVMLTAIIFCHKMMFIVPFGLLLSGFCLLVATLGKMNPQITNQVPVLNSPILSLHVSLIMIAYTLLTFTFLNALTAIILSTSRHKQIAKQQMEKLKLMSQFFAYPALAMLGIGIFVGAIWANLSWGRYWSWDPKESWALISFIVYSATVHEESFSAFKKPLFYHLYMVLAFLTILMTYFGVNYFLGGMHSYANN